MILEDSGVLTEAMLAVLWGRNAGEVPHSARGGLRITPGYRRFAAALCLTRFHGCRRCLQLLCARSTTFPGCRASAGRRQYAPSTVRVNL